MAGFTQPVREAVFTDRIERRSETASFQDVDAAG